MPARDTCAVPIYHKDDNSDDREMKKNGEEALTDDVTDHDTRSQVMKKEWEQSSQQIHYSKSRDEIKAEERKLKEWWSGFDGRCCWPRYEVSGREERMRAIITTDTLQQKQRRNRGGGKKAESVGKGYTKKTSQQHGKELRTQFQGIQAFIKKCRSWRMDAGISMWRCALVWFHGQLYQPVEKAEEAKDAIVFLI